MPSVPDTDRVAAAAAVSGLLALGATALYFDRLPDPEPGGFVAGLAAAFGLLLAATGVLALAEATACFAVGRVGGPGRWAGGLLAGGAGAGGLAALVGSAATLTLTVGGPPSDLLFGAWGLLAVVGPAATAVGTVLAAAAARRRVGAGADAG
jgi:ABC-type multidrug transport system permease subunit